MSKTITSYVGLDIHKDSIAIAVADAGPDPSRFIGTTDAELTTLNRALGRVSRAAKTLVVYEAGPCGYGWARHLRSHGWKCEIIAPAHIVRSPSEKRPNTDRRDALLLRGNLGPATWLKSSHPMSETRRSAISPELAAMR